MHLEADGVWGVLARMASRRRRSPFLDGTSWRTDGCRFPIGGRRPGSTWGAPSSYKSRTDRCTCGRT